MVYAELFLLPQGSILLFYSGRGFIISKSDLLHGGGDTTSGLYAILGILESPFTGPLYETAYRPRNSHSKHRADGRFCVSIFRTNRQKSEEASVVLYRWNSLVLTPLANYDRYSPFQSPAHTERRLISRLYPSLNYSLGLPAEFPWRLVTSLSSFLSLTPPSIKFAKLATCPSVLRKFPYLTHIKITASREISRNSDDDDLRLLRLVKEHCSLQKSLSLILRYRSGLVWRCRVHEKQRRSN
jgi:hypothetical protein